MVCVLFFIFIPDDCVCMYLPIYLCRLGGGAGAGVRDAELPDTDEPRGAASAASPHQAAPAGDPVPADGVGGGGDGPGHHGGESMHVYV